MSLAKFRHQYPQGSLVSELIEIDRGSYIVKALIQIDSIILATALASGATVEAAEDAARDRAIAMLFLDRQQIDLPNLNSGSKSQPKAVTSPATPPPSTKISPSVTDSSTEREMIATSPQPQPKQNQEVPATAPEPAPAPQLELEPEVMTEQSSEPETSSSNNLFGDTFTAETPEVAPLFAERPESVTVEPTTANAELAAMDFNEIKQKTDIEIKRLGWTKDQGKEFLMSRYGKRSRLHLTDEQLLEFLRYLEELPNPVV